MTLRTITSHLGAIGCDFPEIGLLQPADPFLDTTGEDLRRRIFLTQENSGSLLCLRPEFTVPVCLSHLASGKSQARYAYGGSVFRQRTDAPSEFVQAGFENLGDTDKHAADLHCIQTALDVLRATGQKGASLVLGNQAIFLDLLEALDIPLAWRKKLVRSFGDSNLLRENLARISTADQANTQTMPETIQAGLAANDMDALSAAMAEHMTADGLPLSGGRTPLAIAERLLEQYELASSSLSTQTRDLLQAYLEIDVALSDAADRLRAFAKEGGLALEQGIATLESLAAGLGATETPCRFRAAFGRRLDYYTGLVFELHRDGEDKPLIGGGRYDRLLTLLGSSSEIPAVGFAVWVDRLGGGS